MAKFTVALIGLLIVSAVVWQYFVADTLYNCTDSVPGDFLFPGSWVHEHGHQPVLFVPVVTARPMNEPDTIKLGWSIPRLWCLWSAFVGASILISILLARVRWVPERSRS